MSWNISMGGPVSEVKEKIAKGYADHGWGHATEAEKPVELIVSALEQIEAHPNSHVSVSAHGHDYHDGNHRQYEMMVLVKVAPAPAVVTTGSTFPDSHGKEQHPA